MSTPVNAKALTALEDAHNASRPIVAILGQSSGWQDSADPVLIAISKHLNRHAANWSDILTRQEPESPLYDWAAERFSKRIPSEPLVKTLSLPFSAVFTSSIDPGIINLLSTSGREPEPILKGRPSPSIIRSERRPPLFYLFGRAGVGEKSLDPPNTKGELAQRRLGDSVPMLNLVTQSATALGLIIIDGYAGKGDWLKAEDLLAAIASAPTCGVIWFGADPDLDDDDQDQLDDLIHRGIVLRHKSSIDHAFALLEASERIVQRDAWDDPEIISLPNDRSFVVPPQLRLVTEASGSIVDNSWTDFIRPETPEAEFNAFRSFHSANLSERSRAEGVRRGFSIPRMFEESLLTLTERAIGRHHEQDGAIILHGQSGAGKSIGLSKLITIVRSRLRTPILVYSGSRLPQALEASPFIDSMDKVGCVTLLILDFNIPPKRYDDLLFALRSGGKRVVVVGTSYRVEEQNPRYVLANSQLSKRENDALQELKVRFELTDAPNRANNENTLAKFYWTIPSSRGTIAHGLGKEANSVELELRRRGSKRRSVDVLNAVALALVDAGFPPPTRKLLADDGGSEENGHNSAAARIIDYVMVSSRLYKGVPVNLLLRAVSESPNSNGYGIDQELILELFDGHDLFRWELVGNAQSELVVSSRLQIEAELVCNRRLGSPSKEAKRIIELISRAYHADVEDSEESRYVADIVYAIGPDGPEKQRYKPCYLDIAEALTSLRTKGGVKNARIMLQESVLRRNYIRNQTEIDADQRSMILNDAMNAINSAIEITDPKGKHRTYAARRTREHLFTERAAVYGFLATDSAQRGSDAGTILSSYRAAMDAARLAAGRVLSYQPLDISLWVPIRVLKDSTELTDAQRFELISDLRSTLDLVDPTTLEPSQIETFRRQEAAAGQVLGDAKLTESALRALDEAGSTLGYYLRARSLAPTRPSTNEPVTQATIDSATGCRDYLRSIHPLISADQRCLQLLVSMEWIISTKNWLFRGLRQPIPWEQDERERILSLLSQLRQADELSFGAQYRYLEIVMTWLTSDEKLAVDMWRSLGKDTDLVDFRRVSNRHTITDALGLPNVYTGVVTRQIGDGKWSVRVQKLNREVDLVQGDFPTIELALGRTVANFAVSFNFVGPIADPIRRKGN
ncbi:TPA: hypothetical protein ACOFD8_003399 [Stenotrophomonas maltophilia]